MRDYDYRTALASHYAEHIEKLLGLLRSENSRRFVKDKYFRTSVQDLKYLDRLFFADGHIVYFFVKVNVKTELFAY